MAVYFYSDEDEQREDADYTPQTSKRTKKKENKCRKAVKPKTKKKPSKKKPWKTEETKAVIEYFRINVKEKKVPGKKTCEDCILKNQEALKCRSWKDIKYYVKNYIDEISKHTK